MTKNDDRGKNIIGKEKANKKLLTGLRPKRLAIIVVIIPDNITNNIPTKGSIFSLILLLSFNL